MIFLSGATESVEAPQGSGAESCRGEDLTCNCLFCRAWDRMSLKEKEGYSYVWKREGGRRVARSNIEISVQVQINKK